MTLSAHTDAHSPSQQSSRPRRWWLIALFTLIALLAAVYLAVLGKLWFGQESLIFHPTPLPAGHTFQLPADVHEVTIDVPGAKLDAVHMQLPHPDGVVFYLHGNAGNLTSWFVNADFYRALNVDLFMVDYRGFGKSTGHIESEAQLLADVQAAWQTVAKQYEGRHVVFFGRSLGTGLAAKLTASLPPGQRPELLVLVSPYISMTAMAHEQYPFVPSALLRYPLRTDEAIKALGGATPVLILHGDKDALIPYRHAQVLSSLTPGVQLQAVPGAGHNDIQTYDVYLDKLRRAIASTVRPPH